MSMHIVLYNYFFNDKKMSGTLAQQHKDGLKFFFDNQLEAT